MIEINGEKKNKNKKIKNKKKYSGVPNNRPDLIFNFLKNFPTSLLLFQNYSYSNPT